MNNDLKKHMNAVLPIIPRDRLESTTAYALRLTPYDKYGDKEIMDMLRPFDYVYVNELSKKKKPHSHIVLFTEYDEEKLREYVRVFLRKYFVEPPKRGDANKQYNLSEVEDIELAITYLLKDSPVVITSDRINKDCVESLKKKSYKKYSKDEFKQELERLKDMFKENDTPLGEMMIAMVQLKSLYRQPINMHYIYQMCVSFDVHNHKNKARLYVENFLSRLS